VVIQGILFGLAAAFCQSVCYILSRFFVTREGNSSPQLFVLSHVTMGGMAVVLLPFLHSSQCPRIEAYLFPMLGAALFYLAGQAALFQTLRWTEASRVSPMLGLKILFLALITAAFLGQSLSVMRWSAVVLCVLAAFVLNYSGGSIPWQAVLSMLFCCLGYSLSDLSIGELVERLREMGSFRGAAYGVCATYVVTGAVGVALLPFVKRDRLRRRAWYAALPVSISWFLAMVCLYASFKLIGVVPGNIMQSTRGILSILLGGLIAHRGMTHIESRVAAGVLWSRVGGAVLMFGAIVLYLVEAL